MKQIQLQPRLQLLASLVPKGSRFADVGTDHGYIPAYLVMENAVAAAIASDIGSEPLLHAKRTAEEYGVKNISFRLCPGLRDITPQEIDCILIAGMGGENIISILEGAPWTKKGDHLLILQPMTKVETLRVWLADNGYRFTLERLAKDKGTLYPIMVVRGGKQSPLTERQKYTGVCLSDDPYYSDYVRYQAAKMQTTIDGLFRSGEEGNRRRAMELTAMREMLFWEIKKIKEEHDKAEAEAAKAAEAAAAEAERERERLEREAAEAENEKKAEKKPEKKPAKKVGRKAKKEPVVEETENEPAVQESVAADSETENQVETAADSADTPTQTQDAPAPEGEAAAETVKDEGGESHDDSKND